MQGLGFRVGDSEFLGSGLWVEDLEGFRVQSSGSGIQGSGLRLRV